MDGEWKSWKIDLSLKIEPGSSLIALMPSCSWQKINDLVAPASSLLKCFCMLGAAQLWEGQVKCKARTSALYLQGVGPWMEPGKGIQVLLRYRECLFFFFFFSFLLWWTWIRLPSIFPVFLICFSITVWLSWHQARGGNQEGAGNLSPRSQVLLSQRQKKFLKFQTLN